MTLLIHLGIRKDEAPTFNEQFKRLVSEAGSGTPEITTGYDGWETWGVPYGVEDNDSETIHVKIETTTPMVLLNLIVSRFETFLVPKSFGTKIIVTDTDDESIAYSEFCYPEL